MTVVKTRPSLSWTGSPDPASPRSAKASEVLLDPTGRNAGHLDQVATRPEARIEHSKRMQRKGMLGDQTIRGGDMGQAPNGQALSGPEDPGQHSQADSHSTQTCKRSAMPRVQREPRKRYSLHWGRAETWGCVYPSLVVMQARGPGFPHLGMYVATAQGP